MPSRISLPLVGETHESRSLASQVDRLVARVQPGQVIEIYGNETRQMVKVRWALLASRGTLGPPHGEGQKFPFPIQVCQARQAMVTDERDGANYAAEAFGYDSPRRLEFTGLRWFVGLGSGKYRPVGV